MKLPEKVATIQTRKDFISFVHLLIQDLRENHTEWENRDLESFLEAITAWVEDMEGYYQNKGLPLPRQPDWNLFGQILLAAKIYE
ncbi:hypothetical protein HUU05_29225 [candidate division KSB1 bacterium]|nr:hypothetical protein [candidate division KSB1 bacterium]